MPALQSLITTQVGEDKQGQLQGVLGQLGQLGSRLRPLFFSMLDFGVGGSWPGLIWLVVAAIYLLALPLMLGIKRRVAGRSPDGG